MPAKVTTQSTANPEAARKRGHEKALAQMAELSQGLAGLSIAEIDARIRGVRQIFSGRDWHEFSHRAVHIQSGALAPLNEALENAHRSNAAMEGVR